MMRFIEKLVELFGGKRQGLARVRDALSLLQVAIAVAAVTLAQSASPWAVALTVLLATLAMLRPLPEVA
jgi:nitrate reductase assembly molybdenum cofactor insertion protein NarJ